MRRGHHNNHRDSLPVFSHPYLVPVPAGGFEPPSSPYESDARNQLRYTDVVICYLRRAEVLIPIHITANDLFSRQSRHAYPVDSPWCFYYGAPTGTRTRTGLYQQHLKLSCLPDSSMWAYICTPGGTRTHTLLATDLNSVGSASSPTRANI